jgi:hypothetical protein
MATRPQNNLKNALMVTREVETAQTVAIGRVVKDGNADGECQHTTDGVGQIGVVVELGKLAGAAGDKVTIALLAGCAIVQVLVGTGGATRGKYAKCVADGVTDAAESVTTPVAAYVCGKFLQSGVAGDYVGMYVLDSWITE